MDISIAGEFIQPTGPSRSQSRVRSRSIGTRAASPLSSLGSRSGSGSAASSDLSREWEAMPNFHDQKTLHEWWQKQQKRRQSEVEGETSGGTDTLEPPFSLEVLTILAIENPDLYAAIDQLATDVAGLGWMIRDKKELGDIETGAEGTPAVDEAAAAQRKQAETFFKEAPGDFDNQPMDLEKVLKCEVFDKKSTGNGYIEISSTAIRIATMDGVAYENVEPAGLFHIPSRLMRRLKHGGWKQIDEQGRDVNVFRDWGSEPNHPSSIVTKEEDQKYRKARAGELKNQVRAFKDYHSAEAHYGIPSAIPALRSIFGTIYAENRNLRFFINRGLPDWLIEVKADNEDLADDSEIRSVIDENIDNIEAHIKYVLEGEDHRVMVNEIPRDRCEFTWTRLTQPIEDADFPTYRIDNRDTTLRVYRVPHSRLGINETANLGTGSGQNQAETYKTSIVDPEQRELANFLNEILVALGLNLVEFVFVEMDVLDELRQAQIFAIYWGAGIMSVNEGRRFASLYLKDLELPDLEEDLADIPVKMAEFQGFAGAAPAGAMGMPGSGPPPLPDGPAGPSFRRMQIDPTYARIHRELRTMRLRRLDAGGQGTEVKGEAVEAT